MQALFETVTEELPFVRQLGYQSYLCPPLVLVEFETSWRTVDQLSSSTVTADNQCTVDIGIYVHTTVESSLHVTRTHLVLLRARSGPPRTSYLVTARGRHQQERESDRRCCFVLSRGGTRLRASQHGARGTKPLAETYTRPLTDQPASGPLLGAGTSRRSRIARRPSAHARRPSPPPTPTSSPTSRTPLIAARNKGQSGLGSQERLERWRYTDATGAGMKGWRKQEISEKTPLTNGIFRYYSNMRKSGMPARLGFLLFYSPSSLDRVTCKRSSNGLTAALVVLLLWVDYSLSTKASRVRFSLRLSLDSRMWNRAECCSWSAGFLGISSLATRLHSGPATYSARFTLIGSQNLDVKRHADLFIHSLKSFGASKTGIFVVHDSDRMSQSNMADILEPIQSSKISLKGREKIDSVTGALGPFYTSGQNAVAVDMATAPSEINRALMSHTRQVEPTCLMQHVESSRPTLSNAGITKPRPARQRKHDTALKTKQPMKCKIDLTRATVSRRLSRRGCVNSVAATRTSLGMFGAKCSTVMATRKKKEQKKMRFCQCHPVTCVRNEFGAFYTLHESLRRDEEIFLNYYRMSVSSFDELCAVLKPHMNVSDTNTRKCIPHEERIAVTLR
ncbi:hypothetical protein PR048_029636 [Dryococelus australis]|uniref:Uncharacterized protein n=1 Tax=Dryococelus australis TaxID=614101 RepID=A0ABQ9GG10_9NEOP|nr:hypothetical protein PR048_029636 [Dryococelus australis]